MRGKLREIAFYTGGGGFNRRHYCDLKLHWLLQRLGVMRFNIFRVSYAKHTCSCE